MRSPLVLAAADYLSRGLAVIALTGKTPNVKVHKQGLHQPLEGSPESEADFDLLASVFDHPDTTGVGILTRWPYVVVDIDGPLGEQQWAELIGFGPDSKPTDMLADAAWWARTGRGYHLWFNTFELKTGTIKLGSKLDLKGDGGYVAAPPSKHFDENGKQDAVYEWVVAPSAEKPPKEVPEQLRERIEDHLFDLQGKLAAKEIRRHAWGPKFHDGDTVFFAQANHDALIVGMTEAADGNRNNYLHWAAATLSEEGGSDDEFDQLAKAALDLGLDKVEVKRTIRSARKAHG